MRRLPIFLLPVFVSISVAQTMPDLQYEGTFEPAYYSGGYLLVYDWPAYKHVDVYGPDAKLLFSSSTRGRAHVIHTAWALDTDGTLARNVQDADQGQIEILDRSGSVSKAIQTGVYIAQHLAFAPDHTIWSVGFEARYESRGGDFDVLRHYARDGREIGRGLWWSQMADDFNAYTELQSCVGAKFLQVSKDRVGFVADLREGRTVWIETDTSGTLLAKYRLRAEDGLFYSPRVMTEDGTLYAAICGPASPHVTGWATLDRGKSEWRKVRGYPKGVMIGADGDRLAFMRHDAAWSLLRFVPAAQLQMVESPNKVSALARY